VRLEPHPGFVQTAPSNLFYEVSLESGQALNDIDFGVVPGGARLPNLSPVFVSDPPNVSLTSGGRFLYVAIALDADGDSLSFDLVERPEGMLVETNTGIVAWRSRFDQVGQHEALLRVLDGRGGAALQTLHISVLPHNTPPLVTTFPPGPAVVELPYEYVVRAQDAEHQPLTFALTANERSTLHLDPNPADESSAILRWTRRGAQAESPMLAARAGNWRGFAERRWLEREGGMKAGSGDEDAGDGGGHE
jgi:hypothetical protein